MDKRLTVFFSPNAHSPRQGTWDPFNPVWLQDDSSDEVMPDDSTVLYHNISAQRLLISAVYRLAFHHGWQQRVEAEPSVLECYLQRSKGRFLLSKGFATQPILQALHSGTCWHWHQTYLPWLAGSVVQAVGSGSGLFFTRVCHLPKGNPMGDGGPLQFFKETCETHFLISKFPQGGLRIIELFPHTKTPL